MKRILLEEVNKTVKKTSPVTFIEVKTEPFSAAGLADDIIDSMTDSLFVTDPDLRIRHVNQAALKLTGYTENELTGHSIKMLLTNEQSCNLQREKDLQSVSGVETFCRTQSQRLIPVSVSAFVINNSKGSGESLVYIVRDITERRRIEEGLGENAANYQDLFDNAPVAYHELDMEGRFTRINHTEEVLLGYTSEELQGRFPWEIIVEEVSREAVAAKLAGKLPLKAVERTFIRKDGSHVSVLNEDRLIYDTGGNIVGIRSTLQDITERKRVEAEAQVITEIIRGISSTSNLEELLQLIHQAIEKILYAGNCFVALYDAKTELLNMQFFVDKYDSAPSAVRLGRGLTAYVFNKGQSMLMTPEIIEQLVEQGEVELGGTPPAVWVGVPLKTPAGIIGVLVVQHYENKDAYSQRDVDLLTSVGDQIALAIERKQAEDQLRLFNEKLQQSNRELQDFAYVASHDLQEPLRKIQAFGDRLDKKYSEALGEEGRDYVKRMRDAAGRMQTLIQDLLTFSRVTTKAQPFVSLNLEEITREVLSDLEVSIEQTGGAVYLESLPTIEADPLQMRQLMQNLVGNALKFRRREVPPVVKISALSANQFGPANNLHGNFCQITVEDNGIGFEEKYLDRIFTVFQRLHGRGEYEGSGVGLAVCRKIVERHNGTITARSSPNEGATFIITLPVKQINMEINQ